MIEALRRVIKRLHYPLEVMLTCVRWYVAYPLSLRHIEEIMAERGVFVDHATVRFCRSKGLQPRGGTSLAVAQYASE
jgi:transposase-like protein